MKKPLIIAIAIISIIAVVILFVSYNKPSQTENNASNENTILPGKTFSQLSQDLQKQEITDALTKISYYKFDVIQSLIADKSLPTAVSHWENTYTINGYSDRTKKEMSKTLEGYTKLTSSATSAYTEDSWTIQTDIANGVMTLSQQSAHQLGAITSQLQIQSFPDYLDSCAVLVINSNIELLPDETIEGKSYYAVKLNAGQQAFLSYLAVNGPQIDQPEFLDYPMAYNIKIWLDKNSLAPVKIHHDAVMSQDDNSMEIESDIKIFGAE